MPRSTLPNFAAGLQRHLPNDSTGELARLSEELFRDELRLSLNDVELQRLKLLVKDTGDADRGREVYLNKERSQCAKCHRLEADAALIVAQTSEKIVESIVEPSREIKEGFVTWTVETSGGQVYTGLKLKDAADEVVLRDANGRDIRIPSSEIDVKQASKKSLMPEGTIAQLSYAELIDLLAFLKDAGAQRALRDTSQ